MSPKLDSLKLTRSVDPQGRRTISILTKLDVIRAFLTTRHATTARCTRLMTQFARDFVTSIEGTNVDI